MADDRCIACSGPLVAWLNMPIDAKKNEPSPYSSVLRCALCGLGRLSPLPEPADIASLYELGSYYTHGESHISDPPLSVADRILAKLAWWADRSDGFDIAAIAKRLPAGAQICDVGCGNAHYLRQFKALGFNVIGVDPDASARAQAAERGIDVLEGTAESIPNAMKGRAFDLVIMTHSLEHCRNVSEAMQNAYKLTKSGGLCYVEVPNCDSEHFKTFTICSEMFDAPRHLYFFTPSNLTLLAERNGFVAMRNFYAGYVRDFMPGWRAWEKEIANRVTQTDRRLKPKRHSFAASIALFIRSFWRRPERKYDSVGILLTRAN